MMHSVHASFEMLMGPPFHVLRLRSSRESPSVPTERDILYFHSSNCLPSWPHRKFTLVTTAGLSAFREISHFRAELCIRIDGECSLEEMDALGRSLAELAVIPFREGCPLEPLSVLEGIQLAGFSRMQHALVAHWSFITPGWLPGISPPVLLLLIIPLMRTELDWLASFGPRSMYIELERRGVSIYDPLRVETMG